MPYLLVKYRRLKKGGKKKEKSPFGLRNPCVCRGWLGLVYRRNVVSGIHRWVSLGRRQRHGQQKGKRIGPGNREKLVKTGAMQRKHCTSVVVMRKNISGWYGDTSVAAITNTAADLHWYGCGDNQRTLLLAYTSVMTLRLVWQGSGKIWLVWCWSQTPRGVGLIRDTDWQLWWLCTAAAVIRDNGLQHWQSDIRAASYCTWS